MMWAWATKSKSTWSSSVQAVMRWTAMRWACIATMASVHFALRPVLTVSSRARTGYDGVNKFTLRDSTIAVLVDGTEQFQQFFFRNLTIAIEFHSCEMSSVVTEFTAWVMSPTMVCGKLSSMWAERFSSAEVMPTEM